MTEHQARDALAAAGALLGGALSIWRYRSFERRFIDQVLQDLVILSLKDEGTR